MARLRAIVATTLSITLTIILVLLVVGAMQHYSASVGIGIGEVHHRTAAAQRSVSSYHSGNLLTPVTPTQRYVTTLRLCEPAQHYEPGTDSQSDHWIKVPIPNLANHFWTIYELDLWPESGEVRIPLIRYYYDTSIERQYGTWLSGPFDGASKAWLESLTQSKSIWCSIEYADQTISHSYGRTEFADTPSGIHDPIRCLSCSMDYYKIPVAINLTHIVTKQSMYRIHTNRPELNSMGSMLNIFALLKHQNSTYSVRLPICQRRQPVHYAVAQLKAAYSFQILEVLDWLHYHYLIGFDHFYFHYRYSLTANESRLFQPYIDAGLLTIQRFPINHRTNGEFDPNVDQNTLLTTFQLRVARTATWVLAIDHDEYLWLNTSYYSRACNNSLWCSSPIKDWLEQRKQFSVIHFDTWNVVAERPPAYRLEAKDIYRWSGNGSDQFPLPLPVRRVWKRGASNDQVTRHSKYLYHVPTALSLTVHEGWGMRPFFRDYNRAEVYAYHFHDYPISAKNDPKEIDEFWNYEAVRDPFLSDCYEQLQWPRGTDPWLLEAPYMSHTTRLAHRNLDRSAAEEQRQ